MKSLNQQTVSELSTMVRQIVEGCRTIAYDGTVLYTPDGVASYDALWLRDFSYMAEYAPEFVKTEDLKNCINFAQKHKRADGWMPDRTYADGTTAYAAGVLTDPVGEANLDNTPFWMLLIDELSRRMPKEEFAPLFRNWEESVYVGLSIIPRSINGLVYNNQENPHSPYGFTDTIGKTGHLFHESLLLWRACRMAEKLCIEHGFGHTDWYADTAAKIEASIMELYDTESGAFFAADLDCKQIEVWGNAYMLYIDFPCTAEVKNSILNWLAAHYEDYTYMGQVRHLLKGEYWQRTLIVVPEEEYMNGAYWGTATGWVMWCLQQIKPELASRMYEDVYNFMVTEGSYECINVDYRKLNSFVVTSTNIYGGLVRIVKEQEA